MTHKAYFSKYSIAIIDILLFHGSILAAFWFRSSLSSFEMIVSRNVESYLRLFPWISLAILVVFATMDLYETKTRRKFSNFAYNIPIAVIIVNMITMAIAYWSRDFALPRSILLISIGLEIILILTFRYVVWRLAKRQHGIKKVLVVANDPSNAILLANKLIDQRQGWFVFKGYTTTNELDIMDLGIVDADIVMIHSDVEKSKAAQILNRTILAGKEIMIVPDSFHIFMQLAEVQQIQDTLVLAVRPPHFGPKQRRMKRFFDLIISSIMLIIASPVIIILYILVRVTSPGSAFFVQEREGLNGKVFKINKFRSMVVNAEEQTGPVLAAEHDPRITKLGRFMRMTRLDELPQLFNVIKGDMSLVGPRPERPVFAERYKEEVPDYQYRMFVKPGITGLAQVLSNYNTTIYDKVRYDLIYVHNYSISLDIKVFFQTIRVVLQRDSVKGISIEPINQNLFQLFGISETAYAQVETRSDLIEVNSIKGASTSSNRL